MFKPLTVILITALACSCLFAAPPVRMFDAPGSPPFKVLKTGENPPLDVDGNFVIGPEYVPAPERNSVKGVPQGKVPALREPQEHHHAGRNRFPGRKPLDYRKILTGIVFVLKTGINWEDLPAELGWGCGRTCKNYLKAWQEAGIWEGLHHILLEELQVAPSW